MSTRMPETERGSRLDTYDRPKIWPWVLLAAVVALALWWAASHASRNADTNSTGTSDSAPMTSPGAGTGMPTGSGTGATGSGNDTLAPLPTPSGAR
jgi:hypothetical protein